jgi:enamine deaminase RidA (YjgF/YER057c/UK114 family)
VSPLVAYVSPVSYPPGGVPAMPRCRRSVRVSIASSSSTGGRDPSPPPTSNFAAQVERSFANLGTALAAVGLGFEHVVRLGAYIVNHDAKQQALLRVVSGIWGDHPPARTLLGVARLALPDMQFEVDAVAARP